MHFRMSGSRSITKTIGSCTGASIGRHRKRGRRRGAGCRDEVGHGIATVAPAVIAAGERTDALDAALSEQQGGGPDFTRLCDMAGRSASCVPSGLGAPQVLLTSRESV